MVDNFEKYDLSEKVGLYHSNLLKNMTKPWYKSWTIWFNILLALVDFVNQLAKIVPLPAGFLTSLGVFGNILLRFKTTTALTLPE